MGLLDNKIALVTGGASGIGRASALALAREGAAVIVSDSNAAGGEETAQMIFDAGGEATFIQADVTDTTNIATLVQTTVELYKRLDCAVNNAGISGDEQGRVHEFSEATFERILDINLRGVWHCMKQELGVMMAQKSGAIVNVSSVAGLVGAPKAAAYSASKHAVLGLTKSAALEYAKHGIRINAVCPGYTDTPMVSRVIESDPAMEQLILGPNPMKRLGKPEEIGEAVAWLCSDRASFINGQALAIDGGLTAS